MPDPAQSAPLLVKEGTKIEAPPLYKGRVGRGIVIFLFLFLSFHSAHASLILQHPTYTGLNSGLVGWWSFDGKDIRGGTVWDRSGQGNDGHMTNMSTSTAYVQGKLGQALSFDGSDDYVQVPGLMGSPATVTVSAWAKLIATDTAGAELVSIGDVVGLRLGTIDTTVDTSGFYHYATDWRSSTDSTVYVGTGWHHFVFVANPAASSQIFYVDGVQKATTAFSDAISYSGQGANTLFGKHGNGGTTRDFNGSIDDVRIYNRALSGDEVKRLYNLGR